MLTTVKIFLSAGIIFAAVEAAKRAPFWGAVIVSLPLTSMLAIGWLYLDTHDAAKVAEFARDILFLVPPSLLFFVPFIVTPKAPFGVNFTVGVAATAAAVLVLRVLLK